MDLFDQFAEKYEQGLWTEALETIIPNPNVKYDHLQSTVDTFFYAANLADACVYKGAVAFNHTSKALRDILTASKLKVIYESLIEVLAHDDEINSLLYGDPGRLENDSRITDEVKQFFVLLKQGYLLHEEKINGYIKYLPERYQSLFVKKLQVFKGWELLQNKKTDFCHFIQGNHWIYFMPWIPYAYPLEPVKVDRIDENKIPLIFCEPLQAGYECYFKPFRGKKIILAVETLTHLFQMLQFSYIHQLLDDPNVFFYVMEFFPEEQFRAQGFEWNEIKEIQPFFMIKRPQLEAFLPALSEAFHEFFIDPKKSDRLYVSVKNALFNIQADRYGKSRFIALKVEDGLQIWFHDIKRKEPKGDRLGPPKIDYLQDLIDERAKERSVRPFKPEHKINLTHVVAQIVDGGHAPTKLLDVLCKNADGVWFNLSILSTERLIDHPLNYPTTTYSSESSLIRGTYTIKTFNQMGIKTLVDEAPPTFEATINNIRLALNIMKTDVVIFHGPDEINQLVSASCDVPIRILFDHGTLPTHGCFDLVILSTEEAYHQNRERFSKMGMESCYLPFSINVSKDWDKDPTSRSELGIPEEAFVMTTISSHLATRLTPEMCEAIAQILKRCPKAFYAPMGEAKNRDKWIEIFQRHGVSDRVKFLGYVNNPSQYARSMNLYLNEFPFGSGLGMLDAMASGCPVVSMYDETGPQQARYAGTYFGLDHVIKSGNPQDYVDLACRLIEDPGMYEEWSLHTLRQYEKRTDVKQYVQNIELIIEHFIEYRKQAS